MPVVLASGERVRVLMPTRAHMIVLEDLQKAFEEYGKATDSKALRAARDEIYRDFAIVLSVNLEGRIFWPEEIDDEMGIGLFQIIDFFNSYTTFITEELAGKN